MVARPRQRTVARRLRALQGPIGSLPLRLKSQAAPKAQRRQQKRTVESAFASQCAAAPRHASAPEETEQEDVTPLLWLCGWIRGIETKLDGPSLVTKAAGAALGTCDTAVPRVRHRRRGDRKQRRTGLFLSFLKHTARLSLRRNRRLSSPHLYRPITARTKPHHGNSGHGDGGPSGGVLRCSSAPGELGQQGSALLHFLHGWGREVARRLIGLPSSSEAAGTAGNTLGTVGAPKHGTAGEANASGSIL